MKCLPGFPGHRFRPLPISLQFFSSPLQLLFLLEGFLVWAKCEVLLSQICHEREGEKMGGLFEKL